MSPEEPEVPPAEESAEPAPDGLDLARSLTRSTAKSTATGRAKAMHEQEGFVKVLADAKTDRLLGVHILGPRASELIAECVTVMEYHGSAEDIARCTHAHPTLSEAVGEAARAAYAGSPINS